MSTIELPGQGTVSRRDFISTTALAGSGLLVAISADAQAETSKPCRKRYALVGVGSRSGMYRDAILKTYAKQCDIHHPDLSVPSASLFGSRVDRRGWPRRRRQGDAR